MTQVTTSAFVALGHYRILRHLDYGGMSEIYLARDERLQRIVALKVVDMAQEDHVQRFRREVETLMMLSHEHILPVYDWDEQDGWCYFAMPYLEQGSLRERLKQGPLPLEEAGSIFAQVASALHYAHEQGVLHRDIKPSNILFRDACHVYLADFGLARLVEQEGGITQTGCLIGTPEYVAPELATEPADQRSDIYALGVLLYKMLTGRVPFKAGTALALHWKHANEQPARPSSLNPAIAPALERIILKALEKDPANRFNSVQQMAEAYRESLRVLKHARTGREWNISFSYRLRLSLVRAQTVVRFLRTKIGGGKRPMLIRLHRATAACVMIIFLCIAPLCLGFSLSQQDNEQAESLIGLQAATPLLAAQPLLQRHHVQPIQRTSLDSLSALPAALPTSLLYHQYTVQRHQSTQGKQKSKQKQEHEQGRGRKGHGNGKGQGRGRGGSGKGRGGREGHRNGKKQGETHAQESTSTTESHSEPKGPGKSKGQGETLVQKGVLSGHGKPKGSLPQHPGKAVSHCGKLPGRRKM